MPTALFIYVFTAKQKPEGGITLESPFKGVQRNPERLAQSALVPSITRRNVTFKASFDFKKGEISSRDLKIIQAEVDRELRFDVGISKPYRVWNNAFMKIPSLKANSEMRTRFLNAIGAKSEEAQVKYHELITTGQISGNAVPTTVATVEQAIGDSEMEVSEARDQVAAVVSNGEGSFVVDDDDDGGLADLIGGLEVGGRGGRRMRSRRRRTIRRRGRKATRRY